MCSFRGRSVFAAFSIACAISDKECTAKLEGFQKLDEQAANIGPSFTEQDPLFPRGLESIGQKDGDMCGDTAAGQSDSCSKYSVWGSLGEVAEKKGKQLKVFSGRAKVRDVRQGMLGDCYILSAMASMARAHPDFLESMFTKKDQWENDVYTTRWRLSAGDIEVAVNGEVPTIRDGEQTAFAHPEPHGDNLVFWPVILEKAWAKILGSYHAAEGGTWGEAMTAMTSARIETEVHDSASMDEVWDLLQRGMQENWPMGASTTGETSNPTKFGLVMEHSYTVLRAFMYEGTTKAVECFNPWNSDGYHGSLPNEDDRDGRFNMTLEEYFEAFAVTQAAQLRDGYHTTSMAIPGENGWMKGLYEFEMPSTLPFVVSVHWPSQHLVPGCTFHDPTATLVVSKQGSTWNNTIGDSSGNLYGDNAVRAEVESGAGKYMVFVSVRWDEHEAWIPNVHLFVYTEQKVNLTASDEPEHEVLATMLLPCENDQITVTGKESRLNGLFNVSSPGDVVYGVPYYIAADALTYLYFNGEMGHWTFIGHTQWQEVVQGDHFQTPGYDRNDLGKCGEHDSSEVPGGLTCEKVRAKTYDNIRCFEGENKDLAQRYCPATCTELKQQEDSIKSDPSIVMPDCSGKEVSLRGKGSWFDGLYRENGEKLEHVPIFVSLDEKSVLYYKSSCEDWSIIGMQQWSDVVKGVNFDTDCFEKDTIECGRHDADEIGSKPGLDCQVVADEVYDNVNCDDVDVQRYCPKTCDAAIVEAFDARMPSLLSSSKGGGTLPSRGGVLLGAIALLAAAAAVAVVLGRRSWRRAVYTSIDQGAYLGVEEGICGPLSA